MGDRLSNHHQRCLSSYPSLQDKYGESDVYANSLFICNSNISTMTICPMDDNPIFHVKMLIWVSEIFKVDREKWKPRNIRICAILTLLSVSAIFVDPVSRFSDIQCSIRGPSSQVSINNNTNI